MNGIKKKISQCVSEDLQLFKKCESQLVVFKNEFASCEL